MGWYYIVTEEMLELGLKGSDLTLFAIIDGYSRKDAGCFYGGNELLASMAGLSIRSTQRSLHRLVSGGYINSEQITHRGKIMVAYSCRVNVSPQDVKNCHPKGRKIVTPRDDEMTPNNKDITDISDTTYPQYPKNDKREKTSKTFVPPTIEDVISYAESIGHPDLNAGRFVDFYTTTGWRLKGGQPIKDWKACVRTWIRRDEEREKERSEGRAKTPYTLKLNVL